MRRLHLIEIHDQPWCPSLLRDGLRAVLQQVASTLPGYEAAADVLLQAMADAGSTEVVGLGQIRDARRRAVIDALVDARPEPSVRA